MRNRFPFLAAVAFVGWLIPVSAGTSATSNLLPNSGFEEVAEKGPVGWSLDDHGISQLSMERGKEGKYALKIVDPDEKVGSSVNSARLPVKEGMSYLFGLWTYLDGGKPGLGVYPRFWDENGKELHEARERLKCDPPMKTGKWVYSSFFVTPPPEARQIAVWLHTYSTARLTCYVDEVEVQEFQSSKLSWIQGWTGGMLDREVAKTAPFSLKWEHGRSAAIGVGFKPPADWSRYGALEFWLHSEKATGSRFMLIITSENPETKGGDYYAMPVTLNWTGWKKFLAPFQELSWARDPIGWKKIDRVNFTASGWGNTPDPAAVVRLGGFKLVEYKTGKRFGPGLTDEEFFSSLNLEWPGLERVEEHVAARDYKGAKAALAAHLRERKRPHWYFDWRDFSFRGVQVPTKDRAPEQWDYYSRYIKLDWQGWKKFSFVKSDFSPKAFVEGKGWRGKKPIGWHWIRYMAINAAGWNLTPNPGVALFFDDFKLVGKKKEHLLADFEAGEDGWAGLERSQERAHRGRAAGKWASMVRQTGLRCWQIPHDWTDYDRLEFWAYCSQPTQSKVILVLDSDVPQQSNSRADRYVQKKFSFHYGNRDWPIEFKGKIDWAANPTKGPGRTHLWNEALNRHFHIRDLAGAYWQSGREVYVKAIVEQLTDWLHSNPRPRLYSGNRTPTGNLAWQTLTTGIRLENIWPNMLYRCLSSELFTPEVITQILKSVHEQAEHLVQWPTGGNWLTEESMGMLTAGMLFPEFKRARAWRATAIERLHKQLSEAVYPDGMEYELATGYSNWVLSNFGKVLEYAEMNDFRNEIPPDYEKLYEKMFNYLLYVSKPDGRAPALNDSGSPDIRKLLARGYELYPKREDFLYMASSRAQGQKPEQLSYAFPYTGHYVMRSSWSNNAAYLLFDSGPFGYGHQHEDKLHIILHAYGHLLLLDPGNYSYDRSKWRRYVLGTHGHNTIMVDGQGQNRRADRSTYTWPMPWDTPVPPGNDTFWSSTSNGDYARGVYRDGYGPKRDKAVTHTRHIVFARPAGGGDEGAYWIVCDSLTPSDGGTHLYESLFHLAVEPATAGPGTHSISTRSKDSTNLVIVPLNEPGLSVRLVKGQEEPTVQGWANGPWREVPTAVYAKKSPGTVHFFYLLYPVPAGQEVPRIQARPLASGRTGAEFVLPGGTIARCEMEDSAGKNNGNTGSRTEKVLRCEELTPTGAILRVLNP